MPRSSIVSSIASASNHHGEALFPRSLTHALLLLLLLRLSCSLAGAEPASASPLPVPCQPEQASALLRLKASLLLPSGDDDESSSSSCAAALRSWRNDTDDCCRWDGVSCGGYVPGGGQVISLDLSNCACGGAAHLDAVELFSLLPSLTHVVSGSCNDDDSSKSELLPDDTSQQGLLEGPVDEQVNPHHYFDLVMAEEMEETTSWKWIKALLWAVMAFGIVSKI